MSEDALANYIDARSTQGDAAPEPEDEDAKALVGTVKLAEAAFGTPQPSEDAERQSRERVVSQLQETIARTDDDERQPGIVEKIKRMFKGEG
jgi:hypothetical protein